MIKSVCWSLVLLLGAVSCSSQKERFTIFKGDFEYSSKTISSELAKEYNLNRKSKVIVVLTQSETLPQYKKQLDTLMHSVDAEEEGLIYVIGNVDKRSKSSYAITPAQTKTMLATDQFQIRIYDSNGTLKKRSQTVLSAIEIKRVIESL